MSLGKFFTNVSDYIEAGLKDIGIGDSTAASVATQAASVMADFVAKWSSDEKKILLAGAAEFVTVGISGAPALVAKMLAQSVVVTEEDAMDAIRVHLMTV